MYLLDDMGLEVQAEFRVGKYSLDVFCSEVWVGFEADGRLAHAGPKRRERDARRDRWIFDEGGIPVLRVDEQAVRKAAWGETKGLVLGFIEEHAADMAERKERGRWILMS